MEREGEKGAGWGSQEPPRCHPPAPPPCPQSQHSPQGREAPGTDILAAMLDPCYEVGHELLNGAFVLDGAGYALRDLHLVPLAVWRAGD